MGNSNEEVLKETSNKFYELYKDILSCKNCSREYSEKINDDKYGFKDLLASTLLVLILGENQIAVPNYIMTDFANTVEKYYTLLCNRLNDIVEVFINVRIVDNEKSMDFLTDDFTPNVILEIAFSYNDFDGVFYTLEKAYRVEFDLTEKRVKFFNTLFDELY